MKCKVWQWLAIGFLAGSAPGLLAQAPDLRDVGGGAAVEVLARAAADEYFFGIGNPSNLYVAAGIDPAACATNGSQPKVNQAYVWGLGRVGKGLFWGTMANTDTLVLSTYLRQTNPSLSYYRAAEYGEGIFGKLLGLPPQAGDWRPPQVFRHDLETGATINLAAGMPVDAQNMLRATIGIRAGGGAPPRPGNPGGAAILAGPLLEPDRGCAFFVFDGASGAFLGAWENARYTNVRRFTEVNGDLYAAVQLTNGTGAVIRWVNDPDHPRFPLRFIEVGDLDQSGGDICSHEGRLFVMTWPSLIEKAQDPYSGVSFQDAYLRAVGLWMSPVVPPGGLTKNHRGSWIKVWNVNEYEADKVNAITTGGGALASFDGWLYFGTMHVPLFSTLAHALVSGDYERIGDATPEEIAAYVTNLMPKTHRALSLFRGRNFKAPRTIADMTITPGGEFQLLYGYPQMWSYDLDGKTWSLVPNRSGYQPRMGGPGFNNISNVYTWSAAVYQNHLYFGTFDMTFPNSAERLRAAAVDPATGVGGDLYRLTSSQAARFEPASLNGLGNTANYGFRTMIRGPGGLYIGTANPRNMLGDFTDDLPDGGWELLKYTRRRPVAWDLDGDYRADFGVQAGAGSFAAWLDGPGEFLNRPGQAVFLPAVADYDGDGKADPGWFEPASGKWIVWLSSRDGARQKPVVALAGPGHFPLAGDFDGDGRADFTVWRWGDGSIRWIASRKGKAQAAWAPVAGALPALGDYDGNGKTDPAWYAPKTGRWHVRLKPGQPAIVRKPLGATRGMPTPGDFDGDGVTDFALHEPATGVFHVRLSGSGARIASEAPPAGLWLAAPADYDGDGACDFGWYQPGTRTLRIQYAAGGAVDELDFSADWEAGAKPVMAPARFLYRLLP